MLGGIGQLNTGSTGGSSSNPFGTLQSSNQYYGQMPSFANPGQASQPGGNGFSYLQQGQFFNPMGSGGGGNSSSPYSIYGYNSGTAGGSDAGSAGQRSSITTEHGGLNLINPLYPGLSSNFANMLNSQIGQGLPQFGGSVQLPGGGMSAPGSLSAPLNPVLQQLMQMFSGQSSNVPGGNMLNQIANQGISALPEWQAMLQAQQQNIQQNQANLSGQFAGMGDLAGSPFGNAMQNFQQGATATQNALLAQLQQQNIGTQIGVGENLQSGAAQFGSGLQALQNQAIQQQYQQFQTDLPQNNPLLQYQAAFSSLFPPTAGSQTLSSEFKDVAQGISSLGSLGFGGGGGSGSGGSGGGGGGGNDISF